MGNPVRTEDVCAALEPMLGTRFVLGTPLCHNVAECLRRFAPSCMSLDDLYAKVRECIFGDLYEALGQGMVLTLETEEVVTSVGARKAMKRAKEAAAVRR